MYRFRLQYSTGYWLLFQETIYTSLRKKILQTSIFPEEKKNTETQVPKEEKISEGEEDFRRIQKHNIKFRRTKKISEGNTETQQPV